jgi:ParB-like chromosome segregation protein Spo0J
MGSDVFEAWPVEMVPIDLITRHPANFREHDIGAISESIRRWGVWRPLVVQKSTGFILVGNGEHEALRDVLKRGTAPVRWIDVDDANALAILLADNWIPSRGRNMPAELLEVMRTLQEERELFESTGADDDDVEKILLELEDEEGLGKPLSTPKPRKKTATCPECGAKFEIGAKK